MFGIENYVTFLLAVLVFQLTPGPGTIAILTASAQGGIKNGVSSVFGTLCGDIIYMIAAIVGVAAIIDANPFLLSVLQWIGIGYLIWIGIGLVRESIHQPITANITIKKQSDYFRKTFVVSLTNPKVILFFMAFFPLFLSPNSSVATLMIMMAHITVISLIYQICLVKAVNAIAKRVKNTPTITRVAKAIAGTSLIGFGINLLAKK